MTNNRKKILEDLLFYRKPISELEKNVSQLSWWDNDPILKIDMANIEDILDKYLKKEISLEDLHKWFNLIELRDEFEYGPNDAEHDRIADTITYFSNIDIYTIDEKTIKDKIISVNMEDYT
jgi:hypothetical protein